MKSCVVPPIHPLEGRNLHVDDITPRAGMDELVVVEAIDIPSYRIFIPFAYCPSGRCDFMLGKTFVIDDAHILPAVDRMVNQPCSFLGR